MLVHVLVFFFKLGIAAKGNSGTVGVEAGTCDDVGLGEGEVEIAGMVMVCLLLQLLDDSAVKT